jgi:multidrug efflux pump subunit AcrA (membrane-fusion protein)
MSRTRMLAAAGVVVAAAVVGGAIALLGSDGPAGATAAQAPASTATVQRGRLSAAVSQEGTLTYRARPDGSPYPVVNQARGVYTRLPDSGDEVGCGGVLYRVDDRPVLLLCGTVPAYRALRRGVAGRDVRQLNRALHLRGGRFSARTEAALRALQHRKGMAVTGTLARGGAVFLPEPARIAKVAGQAGGSARPGAPVLTATSDTLHVQVNLDPSQQGEVKKGDRALIALPGHRPVKGKVIGFGRVAQAPAGPDGSAADATIPAFVSLDDPDQARGLDRAPVHVDVTTDGVRDALSVPVTALAGRSGGGFAVEVVRAGGRREPVAVRLGLFDTAGGRVQVEGALRAGDHVVVPSS